LVDTIGFVPNGARVYYLNRSQPPFLTRTVDAYFIATGSQDFVASILPSLDKEYNFWLRNRSVEIEDSQGRKHFMSVYHVINDAPRPESYIEDLELAEGLPEEEQKIFYSRMASGAESGWDYSTRWFEGDGKETIIVDQIIPVDLNCVLYDVEIRLKNYHLMFGNQEMAKYYEDQALKRKIGIQTFLWSESEGYWRDYNYVKKEPVEGFYASTVMPIWSGAHDLDDRQLINFVDFLRTQFVYKCGISTSEFPSGEQWDFPNAWSPLQQMIIESLENLQNRIPEARAFAQDLTKQWLDCNYCGWNLTGGIHGGDMFEKYNVSSMGVSGGGGEYEVQLGFGWTNGVVLELLYKVGSEYFPGLCHRSEKKDQPEEQTGQHLQEFNFEQTGFQGGFVEYRESALNEDNPLITNNASPFTNQEVDVISPGSDKAEVKS